MQEAAGQATEEEASESEGGGTQRGPFAKEGGTDPRKVTDQELMGCVKPEEIWKKISKKAAEGLHQNFLRTDSGPSHCTLLISVDTMGSGEPGCWV